MNVGIGTEAAQFHLWEYINRIFFEVYTTNAVVAVAAVHVCMYFPGK